MRDVFSYPLQGATLFADPIRVRRKLLEATDGRAWDDMHELQTIKEELTRLELLENEASDETVRTQVRAQGSVLLVKSTQIEGKLAEACIAAFDFAPLNTETGDGVTELEALEVLGLYMEYAEGKG